MLAAINILVCGLHALWGVLKPALFRRGLIVAHYRSGAIVTTYTPTSPLDPLLDAPPLVAQGFGEDGLERRFVRAARQVQTFGELQERLELALGSFRDQLGNIAKVLELDSAGGKDCECEGGPGFGGGTEARSASLLDSELTLVGKLVERFIERHDLVFAVVERVVIVGAFGEGLGGLCRQRHDADVRLVESGGSIGLHGTDGVEHRPALASQQGRRVDVGKRQ